MNHFSTAWKTDKLWATVLASWYLTIFSCFFGSYLLRIPLPIGGHFFLFRGILPLTVVLYAIWCIRRKRNPFSGLALIEKCFLLLIVIMVLYGTVSIFFAISKGAWFTKYLTMGYYFCFALLFLLLRKDPSVRRAEFFLACGIMLFCTLGGFVETFTNCFFETPFAGEQNYYFMGKWWQVPVFCFYNPNAFTVSSLWMLLIAWMLLFDGWNSISKKQQVRNLWALTLFTCLSIFLYFVANGRLTIWALLFFFAGLAIWLLIRYRKGLWVFAAFASCLLFIYAGEHYDQIKAYAAYAIEQVQPSTHEGPTNQDPPAPPVVDPNNHSTMKYLIPKDLETGSVSLSSDESGNVRLNLLKNSLEMLVASKGLGIGLGNAELRMEDYDNTNDIVDVHCFIMELFLEFGIFAILPLLLLLCVLLWNWFCCLHRARKNGDHTLLSNTLFQIFAVLTYPILSTANSSSWSIGPMWIFLAYILLDNADKQSPSQGLANI